MWATLAPDLGGSARRAGEVPGGAVAVARCQAVPAARGKVFADIAEAHRATPLQIALALLPSRRSARRSASLLYPDDVSPPSKDEMAYREDRWL